MTSSKALKIAIPVIAAIAVGIILSISAISSDNSPQDKIESTTDFESKNT